MEEDSHISMNTNNGEEEEEESGWTTYFEDLSNEENNYSFCASSMISDAASSLPPPIISNNNYHKNSKSNNNIFSIGELLPNNNIVPKKLSLKAKRAKEISHDHSLEDTASSPVNSPKVSDINSRRANDHFNSSLGIKGGSIEDYGSEELEERNEMSSCSEMNNGSSTTSTHDLKKRGLCLVPLSMFVNYNGSY